jgi:hypothetical protein
MHLGALPWRGVDVELAGGEKATRPCLENLQELLRQV